MSITILRTVRELRALVGEWKKSGLSVGLVPTMGYLHDGHRSLIDRAVSENDRVAVSIFVNPTQFAPTEDFDSYPRDLDADSALCEHAGAHVIFHPEPDELYPGGSCSYIDMTGLTGGLCGRSRPSHFRGVCTVVGKLFNIVQADRAYFGQKDAQQLAVIRRMALDLNFPVEIVGCPLVREPDGLAMSSRNSYLTPDQRKAALVLSRALREGERVAAAGERSAEKISASISSVIEAEPLARIDYVEVVDGCSLEQTDVLRGEVLVAAAIYIGKVRLIDNFTFEAN